MTWMAGYIRSILPVGLLGYTRTGRMAPENPMVRLNWTHRALTSQAGARSAEPRAYRAGPDPTCLGCSCPGRPIVR
jgi:hypothetical protein